MNALAIDAATDVLALAVRTEGGFFEEVVDAGLRHAERLLPLAERLLDEAGIAPANLGLIVLSGGPGSFTGLRIAFAAARGFEAALGCPLVSIPTLDAIALSRACPGASVIPVVDAKMGRFYAAIYREGVRITPFLDETAPAIARRSERGETALVTGPDAPLFLSRLESDSAASGLKLDPAWRETSLRILLDLGAAAFEAGNGLGVNEGPFYLRGWDGA